MANIAIDKKIIEKWNNQEVVTNGVITGYTGADGFASTNWPATCTLDLEEVQELYTIRFLLWDSLGTGGTKRTARKYQYELLISTDKRNWEKIYETGGEGINGWQQFQFAQKTPVKFIQIHCIHNTANVAFHIVEIEAHDSPAPPLAAEITNFNIIPTKVDVKEIAEAISTGKGQVSDAVGEINKTLESIRSAAEEVGISKHARNFQETSQEYLKNSKNWKTATILMAITLVIAGGGSFFIKPIVEAPTASDYIQLTIVKLLVLSILYYILAWAVKNYKANRHNYVINKHKQDSLSTFQVFAQAAKEDKATKNAVLLQATQSIFSQQQSGYISKEKDVSSTNKVIEIIRDTGVN